MAQEKTEKPISLDSARTERFLRRLAEDPFLAIVLTDEGRVVIYGKDIDGAHLERIREVLREIASEGD